jgi:hypothetical protein
MRFTIAALIVAAGLSGFAASAQAAPVAGSKDLGLGGNAIVQVQLTHRERRMMRHDRMERRMMRRHMERRMMRREMRRDMRRDMRRM